MSLFAEGYVANTTYVEKKAHYCIDNSGSTAGRILELEQLSAEQLMSFMPCEKLIGWNSDAKVIDKLSVLSTWSGGTYPHCIIPHIETAEFLVIYTDGEIHSMYQFKNELKDKLTDIPIIVVLTLSCGYTLESGTVKDIQRQVNMSIPEGFTALSNDVIIVLNIQGDHRVLMRKGCFTIFESKELTDNTFLKELPEFDMTLLPSKYTAGLPKNMIWLETYNEPLIMDNLYENDIPDDVLDKLCNRMYLPRLDADKMKQKLTQMENKLKENPTLVQIKNQIADVVVAGKQGSDEHKELLKKFNETKGLENTQQNAKTLHFVRRLQNAMFNYQVDATSFLLGSHRANQAKVLQSDQLDHVDKCLRFDCQILVQEDDACILLKKPKDGNYLMDFTNDFAIDSPFALGIKMVECITPQIFGLEIAKTFQANPYTREDVLGFIPLSEDPTIIMNHMCKLFGGREMDHMIIAYISMMCHADMPWFEKDTILGQVQKLANNYQVGLNFNNSGNKVSFREALRMATLNFQTSLRKRTPEDTRAMMKVIKVLMPDYNAEEKIENMTKFIEMFQELLKKHKSNEDMRPYLMEVDEYDHYKNSIKTPQGLVAHLFWNDKQRVYPNCRIQDAIDKAIVDRKFGSQIQNALTGDPIDETIFEVAHPEPTGIHFDESKYDKWKETKLMDPPSDTCIFCDEKFPDNIGLIRHLKREFGIHFYNGNKNAKIVMRDLGNDASIMDIFKATKKRLFKEHGEQEKLLHTQMCKTQLLKIIGTLKDHGYPGDDVKKIKEKQVEEEKVHFVKGDLIDLADDGDFDVIIYGCNCFHHLEGGLALKMKAKYPMGYEADLKTPKGDINKLGTISVAECNRTDGSKLIIANAYIQHHWSQTDVTGKRFRYDALETCLKEIKKRFSGKRIGMPKIGSGLAKGSWYRIFPMIKKELVDEDVTVVIFE
jgi:O-acetyl-ADP-ribose deacetylase (regulator of RNase III)